MHCPHAPSRGLQSHWVIWSTSTALRPWICQGPWFRIWMLAEMPWYPMGLRSRELGTLLTRAAQQRSCLHTSSFNGTCDQFGVLWRKSLAPGCEDGFILGFMTLERLGDWASCWRTQVRGFHGRLGDPISISRFLPNALHLPCMGDGGSTVCIKHCNRYFYIAPFLNHIYSSHFDQDCT
jgi:hypothetical protein